MFKTEYAFHHHEHTTINSNREMNMKVENLEKTVKKMTERIGQLEDKIKEIKSKEKEDVKPKKLPKQLKGKTSIKMKTKRILKLKILK